MYSVVNEPNELQEDLVVIIVCQMLELLKSGLDNSVVQT